MFFYRLYSYFPLIIEENFLYLLMLVYVVITGVNAGHYARELMWNCAERARKVGSTSDPKSVLIYAAKRTKSTGTAATLIASLYDQVESPS